MPQLTNFTRQMELFDPDKFKARVNVIGCGATGTWVAMLLAKLGVRDIHLYDFDTVEEHNLPNQLFNTEQVGTEKAPALAEMLRLASGVTATVHTERVDRDTRLEGYTFLLTDTMASRKEIYERVLRNNVTVPLVIETRMDLRGGRVYAIEPCLPSHNKPYSGTLYSDEVAAVSACGASQSVAPTAALIASIAVWQLINHVNGTEIDNEILIDAEHNTYLTRRF